MTALHRAMSGRLPIALAALAVVGCLISVYLTAFQVGLIHHVWDPLFDGSPRVLTSPVSRLLPVPDASVGAVGYAVDVALALLVVKGVRQANLAAGALAGVATTGSIVAVVLAVLQPTVAHALCFLCLCSTAVSVALAIGALSEARIRLGSVFERPRPKEVSR